MTRSPIAYGLTVLFMLFTVACKGDGADGVQLNPTAVDVYSTVTRHVVLHDGNNGTSVVQFTNLLMFEGRFIYIYAETPPTLPDMYVFWDWEIKFEAELRHTSNLTDAMKRAQTAEVQVAAMIWRNWHTNFYHAFGEDVFSVYNLACKYLHICGGANRTSLSPLFIERQGKTQPQWAEVLPAAESALKCFFPNTSYYVEDVAIRDKLILLRTSVVGVGQYDRKFKWIGGARTKYHKILGAVDKDIAVAYRDRLHECYAVKHPIFQVFHWELCSYYLARHLADVLKTTPASLGFSSVLGHVARKVCTLQPVDQFHVTLINRHWEKARSMVNAVEIANRIRQMPQVASVRTVYLETLSFEQQTKVFASSQVVLMTHGAAFTGTLFMAPGTTLVMYNWMQSPGRSHEWALDYMTDLSLPVNFVGQSNIDRRLIYPMKEKFIDTPNYAALGAEDKAALLEQGICPAFGLSGCDELLFMNFAADWDLLKPALEAAFTYASPEHQAGGFKTILN